MPQLCGFLARGNYVTKTEHQQHRRKVLKLVYLLVKTEGNCNIPSYHKVVTYLNSNGIITARGNAWTDKRLFRFLQNAGYSGLWGIKQVVNY